MGLGRSLDPAATAEAGNDGNYGSDDGDDGDNLSQMFKQFHFNGNFHSNIDDFPRIIGFPPGGIDHPLPENGRVLG